MRRALAALALALLAGPAPAEVAAPTRPLTVLDRIAEDYVHLTLEAGEREPGYVDAYYGPKAWAAEAKAHPRDQKTLAADAAALSAHLAKVDAAKLAPIDRRRAAFLAAQLTAAGPGWRWRAARSCRSSTRRRACSPCGLR